MNLTTLTWGVGVFDFALAIAIARDWLAVLIATAWLTLLELRNADTFDVGVEVVVDVSFNRVVATEGVEGPVLLEVHQGHDLPGGT
jgi:hypothetical protein